MKINNDKIEIAILYFIVGAVIVYLGGLYGKFEITPSLIIVGILMNLFSIVILFIKNEKE